MMWHPSDGEQIDIFGFDRHASHYFPPFFLFPLFERGIIYQNLESGLNTWKSPINMSKG